MAWIELHQSVWTHRKTWALADELGVPPAMAVMHMAALWTWALDSAPHGRLAEVRATSIARAAQWGGDPDVFVSAAVQAGYLDETDDGLIIHDWMDYAGRLVERRQQNRERPASMRRRRPLLRREWERLRRTLRPLILERDESRCRYCGRTDGPLHIDHITPIARGGSNELANLQVLCAPCNRAKGAR